MSGFRSFSDRCLRCSDQIIVKITFKLLSLCVLLCYICERRSEESYTFPEFYAAADFYFQRCSCCLCKEISNTCSCYLLFKECVFMSEICDPYDQLRLLLLKPEFSDTFCKLLQERSQESDVSEIYVAAIDHQLQMIHEGKERLPCSVCHCR